MKRRIFAVLLTLLMLSALSLPIVASAIDVQPYGAVSADGGLTSAGGNGHYLYIYVFGGSEYKTGTSTLYRYEGGWKKVKAVTVSGYTNELEKDVYITLSSGYYKVQVSATTGDGSYSYPVYYNI